MDHLSMIYLLKIVIFQFATLVYHRNSSLWAHGHHGHHGPPTAPFHRDLSSIWLSQCSAASLIFRLGKACCRKTPPSYIYIYNNNNHNNNNKHCMGFKQGTGTSPRWFYHSKTSVSPIKTSISNHFVRRFPSQLWLLHGFPVNLPFSLMTGAMIKVDFRSSPNSPGKMGSSIIPSGKLT